MRLIEALLATGEEDKVISHPQQRDVRPVLVTTAHRGVFFGYAADTSGDTIRLTKARMCLYWSAAMKGVLGLAEKGPDGNCRISPAADLELRNITAVAEVTSDAVAKWEEHPWSS